MEALLHRHARAHLRRGLRGPGPDRRGAARTAPDNQRPGDAGRHHTDIRQQAGSARSNETPRDPGEAGPDADTRPQLVRATVVRDNRGRPVRGPNVAHLQPQVMRVIVLHITFPASKHEQVRVRTRERDKSQTHARNSHIQSACMCILRESFFVGVSVQLSSPTPPQFLLCRAQQSPPPPPGPLINRHTNTYIHAYIENLSRLLLKREWKTRKCYNTVIWVKYMRVHLYTFTIRSCFWVRRVIKAKKKITKQTYPASKRIQIYISIKRLDTERETMIERAESDW